MEVTSGDVIRNELSENAMGGTELMALRMANTLDKNLLKEFQIIHSRVRNLRDDKIRILICHDLPGDPESEHLRNGGWSKFHKIVFVSNWQMQGYIAEYKIPWNRCLVLHNAIEPIDLRQPGSLSTKDELNVEDLLHYKKRDQIRMIYHTTPHRGLNILLHVYEGIIKEFPDITLDVYSSFGVYGWQQRDEPFADLFEHCRKHPSINYHGAVPNSEVREALKNKHIYGFPSTWSETSCLSLMEAMSAGVITVHSNLAALYETGANWTEMYQFSDNVEEHAQNFYSRLKQTISAILNMSDDQYIGFILGQKNYADSFYNWDLRANEWNTLLKSMLNLPREIEKAPEEMFRVRF